MKELTAPQGEDSGAVAKDAAVVEDGAYRPVKPVSVMPLMILRWPTMYTKGYVHALKQAGLETGPHLIGTGLFGREEARELALGLLWRPDPPTAIVAANHTQAMGVLAAARDCGLDVPRQLSVVGYDDIEIASYLGLTTINQGLYESGREGARLLLDNLEAAGGPQPAPARRVLPLRLSLRHATASPPPHA